MISCQLMLDWSSVSIVLARTSDAIWISWLMNCCSSFSKPYQTFPCLTVPKFHALFCRISKIQIPGLRFPILKHTRDISHKMKIIHVQHQSKEVNKPVCCKTHQTSNINYHDTFSPGSCWLRQRTHFLQPMLWPHPSESIGFRSPSSMRSQQIRQSKDDNLERKKKAQKP